MIRSVSIIGIVALATTSLHAQEPNQAPNFLESSYIFGVECDSPFWGWLDPTNMRFAVVSAVPADQVGDALPSINKCIDAAGLAIKASASAMSTRLQGGTLPPVDFKLFGPDGALWHQKILNFGG